ncbi:MAG: NAD-dependent epimerase [Anaerolineae bacterium]|nr:MAG: NAD-dependent epimerase [Anaerolineae bacterium]
MKCIIFGGGGFIGSAIADRLLQEGHQLRIFERPRVMPYRIFSNYEHVEWITGDMLSAHDVSDAIHGMDVVYHLVSFTLPKSSNEDILYDVQTNLTATLHLLNAMIAHRVGKIIFISSGGTVYGNPEYIPIDEKHPTNPMVSYGIVKLTIEKYLLMFQKLHGIRSIIFRVSNPYGPRQRIETAQGAATIFLYRALHSLPIQIWGDGSVVRDYIYITDVADAFARVLGYEGTASVFNISAGIGISLNELIEKIEFTLGRPVKKEYLPARPFDVPVNILENRLAQEMLGWKPSVGLSEGLLRTMKWLQSQA